MSEYRQEEVGARRESVQAFQVPTAQTFANRSTVPSRFQSLAPVSVLLPNRLRLRGPELPFHASTENDRETVHIVCVVAEDEPGAGLSGARRGGACGRARTLLRCRA